MTQATDRPANASGPATLVLPRPNLGPEPWSEPIPGWGPAELAIGLALVAGLLGLATRRARRRRADRRPASDLGGAGLDPPDPTPSRRLIASAGPVRAALVAEFGVAWAARTTEEIALDPTLADRLGPEVARTLVAYLDRVDRAKFAGEEATNVDEWIEAARAFVASRPAAGGRRSA